MTERPIPEIRSDILEASKELDNLINTYMKEPDKEKRLQLWDELRAAQEEFEKMLDMEDFRKEIEGEECPLAPGSGTPDREEGTHGK